MSENIEIFELISWQINKQENPAVRNEFYSGISSVLVQEVGRVITGKDFSKSIRDMAANPLFEGQDII